MTTVQSPPFGDLNILQDLRPQSLPHLSHDLSNPQPDPQQYVETERAAKKGRGSVSGRGAGSDGGKDQPRMLACLNCRRRKIKCYRENQSCQRCTRRRLQCIVPNEDERTRPFSKTHIRELESQIKSLERRLKRAEELAQRNSYPMPSHVEESSNAEESIIDADANESLNSTIPSESLVPASLIARLCAKQPYIQMDEIGQFRFFGPSSSLHTTENVASPFVKWGCNQTKIDLSDSNDISPLLRDHLLEQYWRYQHTVLQVVHREAFLNDMTTGGHRYYSRALLYSILASAAVISEAPEIRALVISGNDGPGGVKPYLLRKASELVEDELENNAGITTVQGLVLLGALHCRLAADTKGWMESGRCFRLIFEMGLHKDDAEFQSYQLSQMDLEVRQVVFWGCFTVDRGWSLYLGRPFAIHLDDITISRPAPKKNTSTSWEMMILLAWTEVLDIVGHICSALNGKSLTALRLQTLSQQLLAWESNLDPSLQYSQGCPPSVAVLHMQYCSAMMLLHRSTARFGTNSLNSSPASRECRTICLDHAVRLSRILDDYRKCHGHARTIIGIGLYSITMAAVLLVVNLAEHATDSAAEHLSCLTSCIRALEEIQVSYLSARTILKQLKYLMRRCKLLNLTADAQALRDANASLFQRRASDFIDGESPPFDLAGQIVPTLSTFGETQKFDAEQFLAALEDCDALQTMGTWIDADQLFT